MQEKNNKPVFNVKLIEVVKDHKGEEKSRKPLEQKESNVANDSLPISWSGKLMPKAMAIKKVCICEALSNSTCEWVNL